MLFDFGWWECRSCHSFFPCSVSRSVSWGVRTCVRRCKKWMIFNVCVGFVFSLVNMASFSKSKSDGDDYSSVLELHISQCERIAIFVFSVD